MSNSTGKVPRRIVTGLRDGKSVIVSDGQVPNAHEFVSTPGFMSALAWATSRDLSLPAASGEAAPIGTSITPGQGETRLLIVQFPPDGVMADPYFDPLAAGKEALQHLPGFAELFEQEHPGMHTTDTVDYGIVLNGEIWLELDDDSLTHLKAGDISIQCGTRHAWRNRTDHVTIMVFVLIGAARS